MKNLERIIDRIFTGNSGVACDKCDTCDICDTCDRCDTCDTPGISKRS